MIWEYGIEWGGLFVANTVVSKTRILHLTDILTRFSDEEHPLDAGELIAKLAEREVETERKAIYRDIAAMRDVGMDVIFTRTPKPGYFLGERKLQLAEIRLLMDGVLSAGFITHKKSMELVEKLTSSVSCYQARELSKQIYIDHRNKQQNEGIYYNVDTINEAIAKRRKIRLDYGRRVLGEKGGVEWSTKTFVISPYALLWYDDRYYVIGNNEKYDNLMHLRVDRMHRVEMLSQPSRNFEEVSKYRGSFDVADYAAKLSNAYVGTPMTIELVCQPDLLEAVLDRFGKDLSIRRRPDNRFSFRVEMAVSDGLVRDILNFGSGVEVVSPKALRSKIAQTVAELQEMYNQ